MTAGGSAGQIIYKALVPTLNMALCILTGFTVSKTGVLPPGSTKGISIITMNVALPCLIFSSMVSAFTPDNISAFGPLAMMAVIYQVLGLLGSLVIRELFYVPRDFRWGVLVLGIISNWGNLPTAVVQTMAKEPPFNPATDVDLGVAYIAVFMLIMNICFWTLGVHKLCGWDFQERRIAGDPPPMRDRWKIRLHALRTCVRRFKNIVSPLRTGSPAIVVRTLESRPVDEEWGSTTDGKDWWLHTSPRESEEQSSRRKRLSVLPTEPVRAACRPKSLPTESTSSPRSEDSLARDHREDDAQPRGGLETLGKRFHHLCLRLLHGIPIATWAVVLGIIFSLVQPLKALLTETPGWTGSRIPNAPDGNPPLSFLLQTTTYLGAVTVPMALIVLGSSFARLEIPTRWRDLPILAIVSMTALKMILIPVFSVFVVQALQRSTQMFPPEQKIRTFVAILLSGTPAAANQLVVTQLYNPEGTADTLASFLLLQYLCMFVLSTGLAAIALYIVQ